MTLSRLFVTLAAAAVLAAEPSLSRADIRQESAANYIRVLFDTSMRTQPAPDRLCPHVVQFGRFAAGHAWRLMTAAEQARFSQGFCTLAVEAVNRLQMAHPGLHLELAGILPAAQGMMMVSSTVEDRAWAGSWPVDWQIAEAGAGLRLADIRLLGLSLGIFLRSLANSGPADLSQEAPGADEILARWRQALDRALPQQAERPLTQPK